MKNQPSIIFHRRRGITLIEMLVALSITAAVIPLFFHLIRDVNTAWTLQKEKRDRGKKEALLRQRIAFDLFRAGGLAEVAQGSFTLADSLGNPIRYRLDHETLLRGPSILQEGIADLRLGLDSMSGSGNEFELNDFFGDSGSEKEIPDSDAWESWDADLDGKVAGTEFQGIAKITLAWRWFRPAQKGELEMFSGARSFGDEAKGPWHLLIWHPRRQLPPPSDSLDSWGISSW